MNRLVVWLMVLSCLTACGGGPAAAPVSTPAPPAVVQAATAPGVTGSPMPAGRPAEEQSPTPEPPATGVLSPTVTLRPLDAVDPSPTPGHPPTGEPTLTHTPTAVPTLTHTLTTAPTAPAAPPTLEQIGQTGGVSRAVAVQGNLAYLGIGPRLVVLDVGDPSRPALVGQTAPLPGVEGLDVAGTYAFVAAGQGGVRVIDLSDPVTPVEAGSYSTDAPAWQVAVVEGRAYVAAGDGLHVLDLSDPRVPARLGLFPMPGDALDVTVVGGVAYLAEAWSPDGEQPERGGLRIVDCSDPAHPAALGFYPMNPRQFSEFDASNAPRGAVGVAVAGGYAYLTYRTARRGGVQIVDISDPARPQPVGDYQDYIYYVSDVVVPDPAAGARPAIAYVATGVNAGLLVLDVSDPARPAALADTVSGWAQGLALAGGRLFLADETGGMHIADLSDPARPAEIGRYDALGDARYVAVVGSTAYAVDGLRDLWLVDISVPERPVPLGAWTAPGTILDVAVAGTTLYLAAETAGLLALDASDPAHIAAIGAFEPDGLAYGLAVAGKYAYLATGQLEVVDISDPAAPVLVAVYESPSRVDDVVLGDTVGCLVGDQLQRLDLSDPARPAVTGTLSTGSSIADAVLVGDLAYLVVQGDLLVVDLAAGDQPHTLGQADLDLPEYGGRLAVAGSYAYIVNDRRLRVVDLSDPAAPSAVASYDDLTSAYAVAAMGDLVYVADGYGGVVVLRLRPTP